MFIFQRNMYLIRASELKTVGSQARSWLSARATSGRATLKVWCETYRQRQALARLDDRALSDIGITRYEASQESEKPFWQD